MYRNCMQKRGYNCGCNNNYENNDYMQEACSDVMNYNNMYDECACGFDEEYNYFPENPMFGQSYVPIQRMDKTFIPSVGLKMGTIFPELVSPYMPGQSQREIEYIRNTNMIKEGCNG